MLFAVGWAVVRSSLDAYRELRDRPDVRSDRWWADVDDADDAVAAADERLFDEVEAYLAGMGTPGLDWQFRRHLNNHSGILTFATSSNHRGLGDPWAVDVLRWLADKAPDSYGLVYLHDDEDVGEAGRQRGRDGTDHSNEFRVWRLLGGRVEEHDDPFLSPIVPRLDPGV